jgi:hypothetical protein
MHDFSFTFRFSSLTNCLMLARLIYCSLCYQSLVHLTFYFSSKTLVLLRERIYRTLLDMARRMIKQKSLPHHFRVKQSPHNILHKCPTKKLKMKVPEEVRCWRKPSVKHLRVFGSLCYNHVPEVKRNKL